MLGLAPPSESFSALDDITDGLLLTNVVGLFEVQASRTPDAIALISGSEYITYAELNRRANQLAHCLRGLGVRPEVLVGVCLERSIEYVVSVLAILKAGGGYVPCDPAYPAERLRHMLADSHVSVLLTLDAWSNKVAQAIGSSHTFSPKLQIICLDQEWEILDDSAEENLRSVATSDHVGYVIYTSGSTGVPKGVQIERRALLNLIRWHQRTFDISAQDRAAQVAGPAFDASTWEIWPYLTAGASIAIPDAATRSVPTLLRDWLIAQHITICFLPTPLAESMLTLDWPAGTPLRVMLTGGDRLSQYPPPALPFALVNNYGPTESTVVATSGTIPPQTDPERLPSIGRPIEHIQVYLLDAQLQPVAIGDPGELYIGGANLARGYVNRPDLTAERFIPNPFSAGGSLGTCAGSRLYRTGDLARFRSDGAIEFLGRIDQQVKIRGFRIELGEIEAVIGQHPAVQTAVVMAREDLPGHKHLVAYIVAKEPATKQPERPTSLSAPSGQAIRHFIQDHVPEYMIPTAFVFLDALPLTPNGKIDRKALPVPRRERPDLDAAFVAARTPVEATLTAVWEDVLQIAGIGIHDNFFDLGGQSLLATRIMARLGQIMHVAVAPSLLFEQPTIAGLARSVFQHAPHADAHLPIVPTSRATTVPASFAQQRMWFMDRLVPGRPLYNIAVVLHLTGMLDVAALEQAINEIVRRHEALRTTFDEVHGQLVQTIVAWQPFELLVDDLRAVAEAERPALIRQQMQAQARHVFDLRHGPLLRTMLIRTAEDRYQLLLTVHHIAFDGWSTGVFLEELGTLYQAFAQGTSATLPSLSIQYADFAHWQQQTVQRPELENSLAYWTARFAAAPQVLQLPTDRPRPSVQTYRGARLARPLSKALIDALEQVSRREQSSLFMTLFAAFQTLLFRYTDQDDIVVGVPIANRNRPELENLIGFFVNTLPLRVDLSGNPTFAQLISRVRQVALEAYAHQDVPLERIVEALGVERDLSHNPLFQVLFVMQNMALPVIQRAGIQIALGEEVDTGTAKFDMILLVDFPATGPALTIEYNTDLFDATTIARLLGHFQTLLEHIALDPQQSLADLPLLTAADQRQLLHTWNDTNAAYSDSACLHTLVEAQARRTPQAIAVVLGDACLTYAELDRQANQLAHHLRELGVGGCPEGNVPVALCVDRSLLMAISVLGILKAGGAYVPLDPSYPRERLAFMLDHIQAPVLLAHSHLLAELPTYDGTIVRLDSDWPIIERLPSSAPAVVTEPDNLAYVLYTSGSTGLPKGVAMPHRPIVNLIDWQSRVGVQHHPPRTLQFSPLSFDVSCQEIFSTWTLGGTLVLIADDTRRDAIELLRVLEQAAVERIFLPFVALQHLAQTASDQNAAAPTHLREIITAGEQLQITPQIERLIRMLPGCVLHNHYGPTETHAATAFILEGTPDSWMTLPPIGQPIANATVRILDRRGQLAPVGVPGEVHIGGLSLARGYAHRPDLTAERFIPDPFSHPDAPRPGSRLYRTGDLARYLPDGNIEFLGRIDQQVKIRGHRVELGEIEAILAQHPLIHTVVVIAHESSRRSGDKRLIAYIVVQDLSGADRPNNDHDDQQVIAELRAWLKTHLPEYMVPSAFIRLPALPLTPSGKVDRRSLPLPDDTRPEMQATFVAPSTPVEEVLAGIWAEVFNIEQVGIHDNFFELGGHSLLATQVMSHIRDVFEVEVPLRSLFQAPTVAGLAEALLADPQTREQLTKTAELLLMLADLSEEAAESMVQYGA